MHKTIIFSMNKTPLLADPSVLILEKINSENDVITMVVKTIQSQSLCPSCNKPSSRIHSRYQRQVADLPWQGATVRMELLARKFFCLQENCQQRIFCERIPDVVATYSRQTVRLNDTLRLIGFMLGGQAGAFLAVRLGMSISADTLLRRIRQSALQNNPTPRVLGVDDWAFQKGHRYGTLLVDLERHRPIDLLPDRKSSTLADWLREHPGVEIISRDRALFYAEGAREGAPSAIQVADRWHLLKNLGEAVERFTSRNLSVISQATAKVTQCQLIEYANKLEPTSMLSSRDPSEVAQHREQRYARYCEVRKLHQQGVLKRDIARITGISEPTIRKYIRASDFPERSRVELHSQLEQYIPYLHKRWLEGCENATQLWHEVKAKGYPGKVKMVERYIRRLRKQRKNITPEQQQQFLKAQITFKQPNTRRVARLLSTHARRIKT